MARIAAATLLLCHVVARAETETQPAILETIVVEGDSIDDDSPLPERSFETPEDLAGFGETITVDEAWATFASTAELLGQSVGAQIRRQGGRDDFSTLSIRGAPAGQVRVLLDGVSLGRASDTVLNLADLPMDAVERIEVYRGFSPVGLTPQSAAAVVNVVTREPDRPTYAVASGLGSFSSGKIFASAAAPLAGGAASAFASLRSTDGDFEYVDDNGTLFNPHDDRVRRRANNDSDALDSLLRWRRPLATGLDVLARSQTFYKDEGVPGLARFSPPTARLSTVREVAALAIEGSKGWSAETSVAYQREELSDFGASDNVATTVAPTATGRWNRRLFDRHWLSASADVAYETFSQDRTGATGGARTTADRISTAVAAGDDWDLPALDLTVSLQLRHQELFNDFGSATSGGSNTSDRSTDPRLGLRWEPRPDLVLKANVATYFRPPTFDESFGTDGFTVGNPDLVPEEGFTRDAGVEWASHGAWGSLRTSYAYFESDIDDVILVVLTFQRTAKAINAARARVRGHELRAEWQGLRGFSASVNYTYQDARNRTPSSTLRGAELPGLAPHEAYARVSWRRGPVTLGYDVDVTGEHFTDSENVNPPIPTRIIHGVHLVYGPFWGGFRLALEGENLGDSLIPDEIGFPLPGRAFYATLSWQGGPDDDADDD